MSINQNAWVIFFSTFSKGFMCYLGSFFYQGCNQLDGNSVAQRKETNKPFC